MNDHQLLRYSRHILLDAIGIEGQEKLLAAHVLVIGAGGLGSPAVMYLAAAGVGHITIADPDTVELTNLQRQIAHTTERIGQRKVDSARTAMQALNPDVLVDTIAERADSALLDRLVPQADVVLDCSDNFHTRHEVNAACVKHGVALVAGAALGFDGQVSVFATPGGPCYACLFPPGRAVEEVACATMGVFAPLTGIIGSTQAAEALKLISGAGQPLAGHLLILDGLAMEWTRLACRPDPACPVCGGRHDHPTHG